MTPLVCTSRSQGVSVDFVEDFASEFEEQSFVFVTELKSLVIGFRSLETLVVLDLLLERR
jgi:hypothetical protein